MELEKIGYNDHWSDLREETGLQNFDIGRVIAEHKERYGVYTVEGEKEAEITGNLRFSARSREDFPAVGDWVALLSVDSDQAIIHRVLPRFNAISRQAVGRLGEKQIIAANIDFAFLLQAADRDFNLNRLERYLSICYTAKVNPIILLTKTDLIEEQKIEEMTHLIRQRINDVPVLAISNESGDGYEELKNLIQAGKTYCMLGSSGVGKSSLMNNLTGKDQMKTGAISGSTGKGRHITSHREMRVLDGGGILIDNPGMREVGIADASTGLQSTFEDILLLAKNCKFKDCTHTNEIGCTVLQALENDEIDGNAYENYQKMQKEQAHYEASHAEKRRKDKEFGKMVKEFKKNRRKGKY